MENYCIPVVFVILPLSICINFLLLVLRCRRKSGKKYQNSLHNIPPDHKTSNYSPFPHGIHTPILSTGVPIGIP